MFLKQKIRENNRKYCFAAMKKETSLLLFYIPDFRTIELYLRNDETINRKELVTSEDFQLNDWKRDQRHRILEIKMNQLVS